MTDLKQIAELLDSTMANAGILDDYDEIIGDHYDDDPAGAEKYHQSVIAGLEFINAHTDRVYDTAVWQKDYDDLAG